MIYYVFFKEGILLCYTEFHILDLFSHSLIWVIHFSKEIMMFTFGKPLSHSSINYVIDISRVNEVLPNSHFKTSN